MAFKAALRQVRVTAVWNTKKPSLHSGESLVRRPRLVLVFVVKVVLLLLVLSHIFLVAHTFFVGFGRCFVVDFDVFIKYFSGGFQVH